MDRADMDRLIDSELARIATGGLAQNLFRSAYQIRREHDLGKDHEPSAPGEIFRAALRDVRRRYPAFLPTVLDPEYFELAPDEFRSLHP